MVSSVQNKRQVPCTNNPRPQLPLAMYPHKLLLCVFRMKRDVIAEDGSGVKYAELKTSPLYEEYKTQAAGLQHIDLSKLNEKEKTVFFISILDAENFSLGVLSGVSC